MFTANVPFSMLPLYCGMTFHTILNIQVHQIRSDFGSRGTIKEIESYYIEQINLEFSTIEDAENHAKALIKPILQLLNK